MTNLYHADTETREQLRKTAKFLRLLAEHLEASDMPGKAGDCTAHAIRLEEASKRREA